MAFKIYDSKAVTMVLSDIPISEGLAETFIKISREAAAFEDEVSADGEVTRTATHDDRCTIELTLKGTSKHNAELSALHALDTNSAGGAGVGAALIKDNNGSTLIAAPQCWITKAPDLELGKTRGDCTWTLRAVVPAAAFIIGGN